MQENDGGIVKVKFYNKEQSLTRLRRELPLHKGAFDTNILRLLFVRFLLIGKAFIEPRHYGGVFVIQ